MSQVSPNLQAKYKVPLLPVGGAAGQGSAAGFRNSYISLVVIFLSFHVTWCCAGRLQVAWTKRTFGALKMFANIPVW